MPVRRRPTFTQENIDQQLQQIHLLDPTSSSENLEQLGPIIKQIHSNRQQDAYLRALQGLIESKDSEIETICAENYQEFISSVSTLFTVKSYTTNLRDKITLLDSSVAQVGKGVVEKKRALLQAQKTASNLDEAIDTMQACLRVLDVVNRVGEMVKEGKYWSALRSLEDIQSMPSSSLSQTPFYQHLLSSLPSLRGQIQSAVTASVKQWLLEMRNVSEEVGKLALAAMEMRTRRWRSRREKDPTLRLSRVGSAVEMVTYEKTDNNILDNPQVKVDFKPLYQCIHIYASLDSLGDLQKSYQADRKAQSDLILPSPIPLPSLVSLTQQICGFFIIEAHVLNTTGNFRSQRDIEELWEVVVKRLCTGVEAALAQEQEPEAFLKVKESLIAFIMTLESYSYQTHSLHSFILLLFEKYVTLLEKQFGRRFDNIVTQDDHLPMQAETASERQSVLELIWTSPTEQEELMRNSLPSTFPWSQTFYLSCQEIRTFVQKFYQFVEGVSQHHRNIDELLSKSLYNLFSSNISLSVTKRIANISNLSQIAIIVSNLEHFQILCLELERSLTNLRSTQRGGTIHISSACFSDTLSAALKRITALINSKLETLFDWSDYDWTPQTRQTVPSLSELINWLTTVVDTLVIKDVYKDAAYQAAVAYIADGIMNSLTGPSVSAINENAISNIVVDLDFLEEELQRIGRSHLTTAFSELRLMTTLVLSGGIQEYLIPQVRQRSYGAIKPKRLQSLLEKLAKYGSTCRDNPSREKGEKYRKEAEAVGRVFPGENR